jgi:alpha/beta superfamily hydrolase
MDPPVTLEGMGIEHWIATPTSSARNDKQKNITLPPSSREADNLVSVKEIQHYIDTSKQPTQLQSFADTSHFFHGQLIPLRETIRHFYLSIP